MRPDFTLGLFYLAAGKLRKFVAKLTFLSFAPLRVLPPTPLIVVIAPLDLVRRGRNAPQETLGELELLNPGVIEVVPLPVERSRDGVGARHQRNGQKAERGPDRQGQRLGKASSEREEGTGGGRGGGGGGGMERGASGRPSLGMTLS